MFILLPFLTCLILTVMETMWQHTTVFLSLFFNCTSLHSPAYKAPQKLEGEDLWVYFSVSLPKSKFSLQCNLKCFGYPNCKWLRHFAIPERQDRLSGTSSPRVKSAIVHVKLLKQVMKHPFLLNHEAGLGSGMALSCCALLPRSKTVSHSANCQSMPWDCSRAVR